VIEVVAYVDARGYSPFARWFDDLDRSAAAKVDAALLRIEQGNLSNLKELGGGLGEYKLNVGPGYRIYLSRRGDSIVLLLCGGTKRRQSDDIARARAYLAEYERRLGGKLQ
jgi:putative addiction module killer protein